MDASKTKLVVDTVTNILCSYTEGKKCHPKFVSPCTAGGGEYEDRY